MLNYCQRWRMMMLLGACTDRLPAALRWPSRCIIIFMIHSTCYQRAALNFGYFIHRIHGANALCATMRRKELIEQLARLQLIVQLCDLIVFCVLQLKHTAPINGNQSHFAHTRRRIAFGCTWSSLLSSHSHTWWGEPCEINILDLRLVSLFYWLALIS